MAYAKNIFGMEVDGVEKFRFTFRTIFFIYYALVGHKSTTEKHVFVLEVL